MRIVVMGYVVRGPIAGFAWSSLQYLMGFERLGHDVAFMEDGEGDDCFDPDIGGMTPHPTYGLAFADAAFSAYGFGERWAYYDANTATWHGGCANRAEALCRSADLCVNLTGVNAFRDWTAGIPVRAFLDMDPVFTQVRHLTEPRARDAARLHNAFLTFGENVGQPGCSIPDDGLGWQPTRHPVVVERCPVTPPPRDGPFSTVMQWESYPSRTFGGRTYGTKSASFPPYLDLPKQVDVPLELAVGSESAPRDTLREHGWIVRNPYDVSLDLSLYIDNMRRSRGEFTVAKQAYVATASGWFSERSATYLACGRPVITQETEFTRWLHGAGGVHAFRTPQEARIALRAVTRNYEAECRRAREVAEEYFAPSVVLPAFLERAVHAAHARPETSTPRSA